jgi:septum formation protein
MPKRLILASSSPRRRELLALLRLPFEVIVSDVDEDLRDLSPRFLATHLAQEKAMSVVWRLTEGDCLVLGADTVVSFDDADPPRSLAKPRSAEEAEGILKLLSGRTHTVFTGLSLIERRDDGNYYPTRRKVMRVVETQVTFRHLTDEMIEAYIATGEPFDKAGGYGIQGYASTFVEAISGDYFNIVGLPVATVAKMLEEIGIEWWRGPEALA